MTGLIALTAWPQWTPLKVAALLLCGYGIVVRPPSAFFLVPFVAVLGWRFEKTHVGRLAALALTGLPMVTFLAWSWLTIHQLVPQARLQMELFHTWLRTTAHSDWYPQSEVAWPLQSLLVGLGDPAQKPGKRAMALFALIIVVTAGVMLAWDAVRLSEKKERHLAQGFLAGYVPYALLIASVGGTFGFWTFERYMSLMQLPILWSLFHRRTLRWPWILALLVLFTVYSFLTGGTGKHVIGFMK